MIYRTEEQAIEAAVDHIKKGRSVAYCFSRNWRPSRASEIMRQVANAIPGSECQHGVVILNGDRVGVPRIPFTPGSGIKGWVGAVVISPEVRNAVSDGQLHSLLAQAKACNAALEADR